jgi:hypothetical protein
VHVEEVSMIRVRTRHDVRVALHTGLIIASLGFASAFAGCGDDDENPMKPPPDLSYPELSSPQNVLLALELAYESRDSVMYGALHDSTYTGQSTDINASQGGTIDLTYADEVAHIRRLASATGVTTYFELGPQESWDRLASDDVAHPEWATIQIAGNAFTIQITDGSTTYEARGGPGSFQEFAFTPRLDSTSQTDTLWRIVRWREIGNSTPLGP